MSDLKSIKKEQKIKLYQEKKIIELIIKYLNERDFENATLFILKKFFPKYLKKNDWEKTINNLKCDYLEKYFEFNKNNYYQIVIDIGFILGYDNGLYQIKRIYNNNKRKRKILNNFNKSEPIVELRLFKYFKYN